MAAAVVRSKQTAGASATGTLSITAPTAGNLLVLFINESASIVNAPKPKDNISGETGWTVDAAEGHKAVYSTSLNSLWLATKVAVGGETTIEATPGAAATLEGLCYFECSGTSATIDTIVHADNTAGAKTSTSPSVTTTDAGDVLLAAVAHAASSGSVNEWTGTGPMTRVETTATRCAGGSYIPATTLSGVTFTANWANSHVTGMLLVALKPEAAAAVSGLSMLV